VLGEKRKITATLWHTRNDLMLDFVSFQTKSSCINMKSVIMFNQLSSLFLSNYFKLKMV